MDDCKRLIRTHFEVFQKKVIGKKAVYKGWCKESNVDAGHRKKEISEIIKIRRIRQLSLSIP